MSAWAVVLALLSAGPTDELPVDRCPRDEHGASCAFVDDERALIEAAMSGAGGDERFCGDLHFRPHPTSNEVDLEVVVPDGGAVLVLPVIGPTVERLALPASTTLRHARVFSACALLAGQPARVALSSPGGERQRLEVIARPSTPLQVRVKAPRAATVEARLLAFPPFDWEGTRPTEARLELVDGVARAPDRVPAGPDSPEEGVWSVAYAKVGARLAARQVSPGDSQVTLVPSAPAVLKVSATVKVLAYWFEERWPGLDLDCDTPSLNVWDEVTFETPQLRFSVSAPVGARRCIHFRLENGDERGRRVPTTSGTSSITLGARPASDF